MKKILLAIPVAALLASAYIVGAWAGKSDKLPAPVAALADRGLDVVEAFDAPSGLTGYAATYQGRPMAIYLTEDGKHTIVGTLFDSQGEDMSEESLQSALYGSDGGEIWERLESSHWVRDGSKDAEVIVYEFTDPNCPFCHKFWQGARPWVEAGKVQVRHVMVGILRPDSGPKAATILGANNPSKVFERSQQQYDNGGVPVASEISGSARQQVMANNELMRSLGYSATPTIVYKKANGEIGVKQGMPQGRQMSTIMGSAKP